MKQSGPMGRQNNEDGRTSRKPGAAYIAKRMEAATPNPSRLRGTRQGSHAGDDGCGVADIVGFV